MTRLHLTGQTPTDEGKLDLQEHRNKQLFNAKRLWHGVWRSCASIFGGRSGWVSNMGFEWPACNSTPPHTSHTRLDLSPEGVSRKRVGMSERNQKSFICEHKLDMNLIAAWFGARKVSSNKYLELHIYNTHWLLPGFDKGFNLSLLQIAICILRTPMKTLKRA